MGEIAIRGQDSCNVGALAEGKTFAGIPGYT
jgi:hypothetical protein